MDGIDAALLETDGSTLIKDLGHFSLVYAPEFKILLKSAEFAVRAQEGRLDDAALHFTAALEGYLRDELQLPAQHLKKEIAHLAAYLGENHAFPRLETIIQHSTELHATAVKHLLQKTGYSAQQLTLIGYHGQTLFHRPALNRSVIVGNGQYLANQLGITVISDFRRRDLELGGQGAPFAPLYHQALAIRDQQLPLVVVNCGGIANITLIRNANLLDLIAFDTGPGNGLIDRLVRQRTQGKESMDRDGHYGKQGKVHEAVLQALYEKSLLQNSQNYFLKKPPKALDIGDLQLIPELDALSLEDACATLEAFTADTIVHSLKGLAIEVPAQWILAGGGWSNPVIYHALKERLIKAYGNEFRVHRAEEIGWNSQALEAQIFAFLAVRSFEKKPLSVPGTTGVSQPCSGGKIHAPS